MKTFKFETIGGREMTLDEARREAGEWAREAHDLCCWPIQAKPLRLRSDAIFAEIAKHEAS